MDMAQYREALSKLKDTLTCPICLELFSKPKILTCHHVYCTACLEGLIKKAAGGKAGTVVCPECREGTQLEARTADTLTPAFNFNALRDAYDELQLETDDAGANEVSPELATTPKREATATSFTHRIEPPETCSKHSSQPLHLYCHDCEKLVCRDCLLDRAAEHAEHNYAYVSELAKKRRFTLNSRLAKLLVLETNIADKVTEVSRRKSQIDQCEANAVQTAEDVFENLFRVLENHKSSVLTMITDAMQKERRAIHEKGQTLCDILKKTQQEKEQFDTIASTYSDQQLLLQDWRVMEEKLIMFTEYLQVLSSVPLKAADVIGGISTFTPKSLKDICERSFKFLYVVDVSKTNVLGDGIHFAQTLKKAQFHVELYDARGDPCVLSKQVSVTAELKSLRNDIIIPATVTIQEDPSNYLVTYTVKICGRYELSIRVNQQHVPNSPFPIQVKKAPRDPWLHVAEICTLQQPTGLAIAEDNIYVAECEGNRVTVFNSRLETLHTIEGLAGPNQITVDNELNVLYVSTVGHQLCKLAANDSTLKVGGEGDKKIDFQCPNGNCFHDGKLYVCDSKKSQIRVFDHDLNLLKTHGKKGQFKCPQDIDIDSDGTIYIADSLAHQVRVFNSRWEHQQTIGRKGTDPGELLQPMSIYIREKQVFVAEYKNNRISVFNTSGQFLTTFGGNYLKEPKGLVIDLDGFVFVSHSKNNILVLC